MLEPLSNKVAELQPAIFLKKAPAQMFYCEFCRMFKSTFFTGHFQATVSVKGSLSQ